MALSTVWLFDPGLQATRAADLASAQAGDPAPTVRRRPQQTPPRDARSPHHGLDHPPETPAGDDRARRTASSDCSDPTMVTGDPAMTRWGPVQVQMGFAPDGTVCGVEAVVYPDGDHHSAELNSRAVPYLDAQAAQLGVAFDTISGATYTSEAYRESMQSILDQQ